MLYNYLHMLVLIFEPTRVDLTFHKAHTNGAHLSEFKDGFKSVVDRLREQLRKLLVVEDLERAA